MKTGTVSYIPDKPGTMIDPGFVSYSGTVPEAISIESAKPRPWSLAAFPINKEGLASGTNGGQSTVFDRNALRSGVDLIDGVDGSVRRGADGIRRRVSNVVHRAPSIAGKSSCRYPKRKIVRDFHS